MFMPRALAALPVCLTLLTICLTAQANPQSCATISNDAARLHCFDSIFKPTPSNSQGEETLVILNSDSLSELPPLDSRKIQELANTREDFAITPHKPNYILPLSYNASADYSEFGPFEEAFNDTEIKMQLSLKTRIVPNLWGNSSLWIAYTQQSYWQLYADSEASAPFRETNHQPEVFWEVPVDFDVLGWNARIATLAFNHQSNGRAEPLSRSWNRITGELTLDRGPFVASAKSWYRIKEDEENDNNPNIEDFMGRLQLGLAYKRNDHVFAIGLKNNLSSDNRSGLELNWTFPLVQKLRGFVQIYSGYGENLIDMENYNNRIGIGIALSDWL
ncbi:MAG: phospholipase A [Congregibacter sp.]